MAVVIAIVAVLHTRSYVEPPSRPAHPVHTIETYPAIGYGTSADLSAPGDRSANAVAEAAEHRQPVEANQPQQSLSVLEYVVREGDSLRAIAQRFGINIESLLWSNDLAVPDLLRIGQPLLVPPVPGLVHEVRPGDTVRIIALTYNVEPRTIVEANGLDRPDLIRVGQRLIVPGGVKPRPPAQPSPAPMAADPRPSVPDTVQAPEHQVELAAAAVDMPQPIPAIPIPAPQPRSPQEAFIFSIAPAAQATQQASGVPASVAIAQAILETSWGQSRLTREAQNYFGIKAHSRAGTGGVVWMNTWEVIGGRNVTRNEPFRAYATIEDSFADYGRFFRDNPRYHRALAVRDDPHRFIQEVARAGYATDPNYASKIIRLMDQYNLYRFDE